MPQTAPFSPDSATKRADKPSARSTPENANGWETMLNYIASLAAPLLHFATPDVSSDSEGNSYEWTYPTCAES